jgi:hypothetical protein
MKLLDVPEMLVGLMLPISAMSGLFDGVISTMDAWSNLIIQKLVKKGGPRSGKEEQLLSLGLGCLA